MKTNRWNKPRISNKRRTQKQRGGTNYDFNSQAKYYFFKMPFSLYTIPPAESLSKYYNYNKKDYGIRTSQRVCYHSALVSNDTDTHRESMIQKTTWLVRLVSVDNQKATATYDVILSHSPCNTRHTFLSNHRKFVQPLISENIKLGYNLAYDAKTKQLTVDLTKYQLQELDGEEAERRMIVQILVGASGSSLFSLSKKRNNESAEKNVSQPEISKEYKNSLMNKGEKYFFKMPFVLYDITGAEKVRTSLKKNNKSYGIRTSQRVCYSGIATDRTNFKESMIQETVWVVECMGTDTEDSTKIAYKVLLSHTPCNTNHTVTPSSSWFKSPETDELTAEYGVVYDKNRKTLLLDLDKYQVFHIDGPVGYREAAIKALMGSGAEISKTRPSSKKPRNNTVMKTPSAPPMNQVLGNKNKQKAPVNMSARHKRNYGLMKKFQDMYESKKAKGEKLFLVGPDAFDLRAAIL